MDEFELEEAITQRQLLNIKMDYSVFRDLMMEVSTRIEKMKKEMVDFNKTKDISALNHICGELEQRIEKNEKSIDQINTYTSKVVDENSEKFNQLSLGITNIVDQKLEESAEKNGARIQAFIQDFKTKMDSENKNRYVTHESFSSLSTKLENVSLSVNELKLKDWSEIETKLAVISDTIFEMKKTYSDVISKRQSVEDQLNSLISKLTDIENHNQVFSTEISNRLNNNRMMNSSLEQKILQINERIDKSDNNTREMISKIQNKPQINVQQIEKEIQDKIMIQVNRMINEKLSMNFPQNTNNNTELMESISKQQSGSNVINMVSSDDSMIKKRIFEIEDELLLLKNHLIDYERDTNEKIANIHSSNNSELLLSQEPIVKNDESFGETKYFRSIGIQSEVNQGTQVTETMNITTSPLPSRVSTPVQSQRLPPLQIPTPMHISPSDNSPVCILIQDSPKEILDFSPKPETEKPEKPKKPSQLLRVSSVRIDEHFMPSSRLSSRPLSKSRGNTNASSQTYEEMEGMLQTLQIQINDVRSQTDDVSLRVTENDRAIQQFRKSIKSSELTEEVGQISEILKQQQILIHNLEKKIIDAPSSASIMKSFNSVQHLVSSLQKQSDDIRKTLDGFITKQDFHNVLDTINHDEEEANQSAGATIAYKCLLCGRPNIKVTGMITDLEVAKLIGDPISCGPSKVPGSEQYVLSYGKISNTKRPLTQKSQSRSTNRRREKLPGIDETGHTES